MNTFESSKPKTPPHSEEAEIAILGGLMLEPDSWDQVSDVVCADDFYQSGHKKIFRAIERLNKRGLPSDIITVCTALEEDNEIASVGGKQYLIEVVNKTHTTAHLESYSKIVYEKARLRNLIKACADLTEKAFLQDFQDIDAFMDFAESSIYNVSENKSLSGLINAGQIVKDSIKKVEELYNTKPGITGVPTGFLELDKLTAGLQPGEMIILAARPSMGKTALSLNMAAHAALREKKKVAYFSVEMAKEQIMLRLLASEAKINMSDVRIGRIGDDAWPRIIGAAAAISQSHLYIDDTSGISPYEIRAKARRMKSQVGLDMIVVDYLQLMDLKQKVESRERAVAEISRTLKAIAKELQIPVVALAQLNRGVEGRGKSERRPMLSDLRESGSIEQDADVIMMLYREEYYDGENPEVHGMAELLINKHRNGPTGHVRLRWDASYGRFSSADLDAKFLPPIPPTKDRTAGGMPPNFAPRANQ
ncbi:MAG: replicative DNA helicase [Pseudomonadota bacterium]|nr:replicative DNA helicase [Pseudomonadota bacterium]